MRILHDGPHSLVWVDQKNYVHKKDMAWTEFGCTAREAHWLGALRGKVSAPLFRSIEGPNHLSMTFAGFPLTPETLPQDWEKIMAWTMDSLERARVCHNDIRPENILTTGDDLILIDWQWATYRGEPIPPEWPKALGGKYKKGEHDFSDEYSLWKSLREVADA